MKIAIDAYSYHRYLGEIYPTLETDPGSRMTLLDVVEHAHVLGVAGISLESCFLPNPSEHDIRALRTRLDTLNLARVWAWGHPHGLYSGAQPEALSELIHHIGIAARLEASVMRICCGGRHTRPNNWPAHQAALLPLLREACTHAARHRVVLAIENHIDLLADELLSLIQTVDSPWLGVCLDTANNLRMLEDPALVIEKLAPYTRATHIKDIAAYRGNPREFAFWPSVPVGQGLIDMPRTFACLRQHDYQGLLALEIDYLHPDYSDETQAIAESLAYMRNLL